MGCQDITLKEFISKDKAFFDFVDQKLTLHHVDIHRYILYSVFLRVYKDLADLLSCHGESVVQIIGFLVRASDAFRNRLFGISSSNICAAFDMLIQHLFEIKIAGNVGVRHNNVFFFLPFQKIENICQRFHSSGIHLNFLLGIRRNNV